MSTIRTNPAYAILAYRKAILTASITFLTREYRGTDGVAPKSALMSEDVLPVDATVPAEVLIEYTQEMQEELHDIELEMGKFTFRKRDDNDKKQSRSPKKARGRKSR